MRTVTARTVMINEMSEYYEKVFMSDQRRVDFDVWWELWMSDIWAD